MPTLVVRIPERQMRLLQAEAARLEISVGELVRRMIDGYGKENGAARD